MIGNRAPVGATAPLALSVPVETGDSGLDLTRVTSVSLSVRQPTPDRREVTWAAAITSQSATRLVATHVFAESDLPTPGTYMVSVTLQTPDGPVPCSARPLVADSKFNII